MLATFSTFALGLSVVGCATEDERRVSDDPTFIGCQYGFEVAWDYQPLTTDELVDRAELIVRGRFESVSDGRIAVHENTAYDPMPMLVFRVQVTETIKGEPSDTAYLERIRAGCTAEASTIVVPEEEHLFFLRPPGWETDFYDFEYPDRGRAPGQPLWVLLSPQGMLQESNGVALPIAAPEDDSFTRGSLDDVAAEVRALLEAP